MSLLSTNKLIDFYFIDQYWIDECRHDECLPSMPIGIYVRVYARTDSSEHPKYQFPCCAKGDFRYDYWK